MIWKELAAQKAVFDRLGSIAEIAAMPEPQRTLITIAETPR